MNSIWNKNLTAFLKRFPELAGMFSLKSVSDIPDDIPPHLLAPLEVIQSKSGPLTAKDNGKYLHSAYNPLREAEQAAKTAKESLSECWGCAFFSCGLGYAPLAYARLYPEDTILIIESDPRYFFTALSLADWSPLFAHENFIIALGTGIDGVVKLIESTSGLKHTVFCENQSQTFHAQDYFQALHSLIERNKRKAEINASTLEKFSKLWQRNTCRNLYYLFELDGIKIYKDKCPPSLPAVILAAGPTLEAALPYLKDIKERAIIIAVDTALRACLRSGVEPDFIVLCDPQYYAYRHIAGLASPSSILITESAAYPAVFRFNCRKALLCSSLFPLGQYIESRIGTKGELVAGGSVATTAWEFARFIGAKEIFCAGLDLGFPDFQTHIKGSTFEENIHTLSGRLSPAETLGSGLLFGDNIKKDTDYSGKQILTDSKMKMFAWWFESRQEEFKDSVKSYSLSPKSLRIPGFLTVSLSQLLERPAADKSFIAESGNTSKAAKEDTRKKYEETVTNLNLGLEELYECVKKGFRLSNEGLSSSNPQKYTVRLQEIDNQILQSQYKEIVSLVFPGEKILNSMMEELPPVTDRIKASLQKSQLIYRELMKSIKTYLELTQAS